MRKKIEDMYEEFRIDDDDAGISSLIMESQSQNTKRRKIEDFNIHDFRFGHENIRKSELERYLKIPCLILENNKENDNFDVIK